MSKPRIAGHVAVVLNRRELVLNVGSADGVEDKMRFAVLNARGLDVRDPKTGEDLGEIEVPKVLVEVVRLKEKLSVVRTFRTTTKNVGGSGSLDVASIFQPRKLVEIPETFDVADKPYEEELSEDESVVKVGDPVIQIDDDEFL